MLYSIENREVLGNLKELISLKNQVKSVRLQDKLGKQSFHEKLKNFFELLTDIVEYVFKTKQKP